VSDCALEGRCSLIIVLTVPRRGGARGVPSE
jgi:hypothetical protein